MPVEIEKQHIRIHKNEMLESLEIREKGRLVFYSYTYMVRDRKGRAWRPYVRWDNWEKQSHVDKYDESGSLIEEVPSRDRSLSEVLKLVKIFRKNLVTMEIADI